MTSILLQPDGIRIPGSLPDLAAFRRWVHSDDFPERGRIDWIGGQVEIDMAPEEINTHGTLKSTLAHALVEHIQHSGRGVVLIDSSRLTNQVADLSVEPDVLVLLNESVAAGRARLVPKANRPGDRFIEIEGAADLVVECGSDSSTAKDRTRLPPRYLQAGVPELWIVDARQDVVELAVHHAGPDGYVLAEPDADGYVRSELLGAGVRLERIPMASRLVRYRLVLEPLP